jgi:hypothetical protein
MPRVSRCAQLVALEARNACRSEQLGVLRHVERVAVGHVRKVVRDRSRHQAHRVAKRVALCDRTNVENVRLERLIAQSTPKAQHGADQRRRTRRRVQLPASFVIDQLQKWINVDLRETTETAQSDQSAVAHSTGNGERSFK